MANCLVGKTTWSVEIYLGVWGSDTKGFESSNNVDDRFSLLGGGGGPELGSSEYGS